MSVYVDDLFPTKRSSVWRFDSACHLRADTLEELYAFADKIQMRRAWIHGGDHFDLSPHKRQQAVQRGAIEVGPRDMVELRRVWRARAGDR